MSTELAEALTAANVSALIQKQIDPMLLEYQRRYSPLVRSLPSIKWASDNYFFNTRTNRAPGGFVTDGGARPVTSSTYAQSSFQMKHLQTVGAVTGYAQEVTRAVIGDLQRREIEGAVQSLTWDVETGIDWGNAASTVNGPYPQFDGFDSLANQFTASGSNPQNAIDEAGATLTTGMLDHAIDMVEQNAAEPIVGDGWMFVMSSTAGSRLAQLLTNQQRFTGNVPSADIAPGLNVPTYRDIPIVRSSFLGARGLAMGTVTTATATTGGTLAAATYFYKVSAVIARLGEIACAAEVSQVTTGSTSTVTLSFSAPTGFENGGAMLYKVYRSTATNTESLLGYVDANVALGADGITPLATTSIVDTGSALIPQNGSTQPGILPTAYLGTNTGHLPRTAGLEDIYLVSRNPDNLIRAYVREIQPVDVYPTVAQPDALPFALISDQVLAVRAPKYMGRLRNLASTLSN